MYHEKRENYAVVAFVSSLITLISIPTLFLTRSNVNDNAGYTMTCAWICPFVSLFVGLYVIVILGYWWDKGAKMREVIMTVAAAVICLSSDYLALKALILLQDTPTSLVTG